MGYIYEAMEKAKEAIRKSFEYNESKYKEVFEIIDSRWTCQLHHPLHAAGHFLNPDLFFSNHSMEFDFEVVNGLYVCLEKLVPDQEVRQKILTELPFIKWVVVCLEQNLLFNKGALSHQVKKKSFLNSLEF